MSDVGSNPIDWTLSVEEETALRSAEGQLIKLPYRKVGELLLAIAQSGPQGKSRQLLAEQLWPSADLKARAASFRQALSHLRRAVGEDWILCGRASCRLSGNISLRLHEESSITPSENPSLAFSNLVSWLAQNEPERFFDVMSTCLDLALGLPAPQLTRLVNLAASKLGRSSANRYWAMFWRAHALMEVSGINEVRPLLQQATNYGFAAKDNLLMREATYLWSACEILSGCPEKAIDLVDRTETAIRSSTASKTYRMRDIRGTALLHMGRNSEALEVLENASDCAGASTLDHANHEALLALYHATSGNFKSALQTNEYPARIARETGALGMQAITGLTYAYVEVTDQPERAIQTLTRLIAFCRSHDVAHIALYAQEALAVAYRNLALEGEARSAYHVAAGARRSLGFHVTRWDRSRLMSA
jgi:tetratricopeptide (TPR) repeat protein